MAFTFQEASCVLLGTFNIYVIRPDWLGKIGLLPEGSQVMGETQLDQPGIRLSSPNLGSRWTVLPDRLILETDKPDEDCGATVDRILECLPWTPIKAIGCNVAFRGEMPAIDRWQEKTAFPPAQLPPECHLKQRSWHVALQKGGQVYNLQLSELEEDIEIRANAHTELRNRDVAFARETAKQFFQFREISISLLQEIFGEEFEHVNNE